MLLSLADLQGLAKEDSLVVGAAGGREKLDALRVVLPSGYISVLITDQSTARALIADQPNT